jgi:hypothetical protein
MAVALGGRSVAGGWDCGAGGGIKPQLVVIRITSVKRIGMEYFFIVLPTYPYLEKIWIIRQVLYRETVQADSF